LASFAAVKASFLPSAIWISAPVAGLRPVGAARFFTCMAP
jgi:hypothetical protein